MCHASPSDRKRYAFRENYRQHFHGNTAIDDNSRRFTDVTAISSAPAGARHIVSMYVCTQVCMNESMLVFTIACRCMVASLRCMNGISTNVLVHLHFRTLVRFTLRTLVGPPRSPITSTRAKHAIPPPTFPTSHTETLCPSLHTPLQSSTLPSSAAPKTLLHTISVCYPGFVSPVTLPSHEPSTTRTRRKGKTKTASCCEAWPRHEANGFGRPRSLQDLFSTTESLQVARHSLAHDGFQLASKFDPAKTQHKKF